MIFVIVLMIMFFPGIHTSLIIWSLILKWTVLIFETKKTVFINPGSVGQPRNQNPRAQYVYIEVDSGSVHFNAVSYDIESERNLYPDGIDPFYKDRILTGI